MAGKLVITTGSSRCGRKELFLPGFEKYCAENGTKVKIYNVGDMIFPWAWYNIREELNRDTILDVNPLAVDIIHAAVEIDIAARKQGVEKCRAACGDIFEQGVDMVIFCGSERVEGAGIIKIFGIVRAGMRAVENDR